MQESIKNQLEEFIAQEDEVYQASKKQKDSFWASQAEAPLFDIYQQFKGVESTNPMEAEKLIMFSAAKMMELALIQKLQKMKVCKKGDDQQHFKIEREGIDVSGYYDGILMDGSPVEIKTMANDYQARELERGLPKTAYLKQLAIYCQALDADQGTLIYLDRRDGKMFEFTLERLDESKFKCLNVEFDLNDTYKKWARFYNNNVLKDIEPDPFYDCGAYKADIEKIDWSKVSKAHTTAARNGHKVIGEKPELQWLMLYSNWKNLWIDKQGDRPGYTDKQIERIKELTKGFTSKK